MLPKFFKDVPREEKLYLLFCRETFDSNRHYYVDIKEPVGEIFIFPVDSWDGGIGDKESLDIADKQIDLSHIDGLKEWIKEGDNMDYADEYGTYYEAPFPETEYAIWKGIGLQIAKEIVKILPPNVHLYYLGELVDNPNIAEC